MLLPIIKLIYNISITGHTRYEAAKRLGMEKIPCIIADDLDIDSFFEETVEEHQKKDKFEIFIRCKDAKQYDKRMKKLISIGWV